ncbi:hypothetical protein BamMEX5DRAFT_7055 [Burkholderia ambifaria MEX-5]|uniref:Uncharacterized protein n=1 Tax=Burkholderia ambifaria MEX-5 TaxID=396597 RepID=B1TGY9_9BURK|nr:hypothetical protein BamMEX5DRAFT_7055 [Burkholderia ambifaria MEX-5]
MQCTLLVLVATDPRVFDLLHIEAHEFAAGCCNRRPAADAIDPRHRRVDTMHETRRKPAFGLRAVQETRRTVAKICTATTATHRATSGERFADLTATMDEFEQVQHSGLRLDLARIRVDDFSVSHERNASEPATRIELDAQRLNRARISVAISQSDDKRHDAVTACAATFEKQSRTFLATRHQWLAALVQNENRHFGFSKELPLRAL